MSHSESPGESLRVTESHCASHVLRTGRRHCTGHCRRGDERASTSPGGTQQGTEAGTARRSLAPSRSARRRLSLDSTRQWTATDGRRLQLARPRPTRPRHSARVRRHTPPPVLIGNQPNSETTQTQDRDIPGEMSRKVAQVYYVLLLFLYTLFSSVQWLAVTVRTLIQTGVK